MMEAVMQSEVTSNQVVEPITPVGASPLRGERSRLRPVRGETPRAARGAAMIFVILCAAVVIFQLALAFGAPWGAYAMGGSTPGTYPSTMRVAAIVQAAFLVIMALLVLARAGLALPSWSRVSRWAIWLVVAASAITLFLNLITPSSGERAVWAPVIAVLFASSLMVAVLTRPRRRR
jgi:hypothetical protein